MVFLYGSIDEAFLCMLAFSASTCTVSKVGFAIASPKRATASETEFLSTKRLNLVIYLYTLTYNCPPNLSIAC